PHSWNRYGPHPVPSAWEWGVGRARHKSTSAMDRLFERAAVWGLDTEYRDAFGKMRAVEPEVLSRLLEGLPPAALDTRLLPRSLAFRRGADHVIRLNAADGLPVQW